MGGMGEEAALYAKKVKRAAQLLFFQRHRLPGVKGWELRRALGKNYMKVIEILNAYLEPLDLQVKIAFEEGEVPDKPTQEQLQRARFLLTLRSPMAASDALLSGWRIDDVAALAVTVAYIISKGGKARQIEVEKILEEKFPRYIVQYDIERFIRRGYIGRDENRMLYLDWRSRAEIDEKLLLNLLISEEPSKVQGFEEK
ncbi:hypothetical protein KEJ36_04770 [Candidatus Bathyarchaeota archaeon]|nr:hypothetical protein [Candidatus Bathyarchaeota archaeon]MBS7628100.1 hypothetical protein [Candidatus Bathyarchaeota archaeon]